MTRRYYHPLTGEPDKEDTGVVYFENKNGKFQAIRPRFACYPLTPFLFRLTE